MLSESHNTNTIFFWLLEWRRNGVLLPKEVVADFSMALINAVCMSFSGCAEGCAGCVFHLHSKVHGCIT